MFFQHVYDKSLAQASYVIGCQKAGVALVIDPKRDVDTYLEIARQNNLRITHIAETHIHADFLSGSRELQQLTGADLYLSDEGGSDWQYQFDHVGLKDGSLIMVGNLKLEVMHTPGHTPESISFLLYDMPASDKPVMLFTGDFVFVGDVGRPDLLEEAAGLVGTKEVGAKQMFQSLKRFKTLPDFVQVWPGHGAGSACGKALGAVPSTTVGYEKIRNWALQFNDNEEVEFVKALLEDQPEAPKYFAMMKKLNKVPRNLVTEVPTLNELTDQQLEAALAKGVKLIDTRPKTEFAKGFIPGSINIQNNNSLSTWMGWLVSYDEPFILLASKNQHDDIMRKLMRIGMDQVMGYIASPDVYTGTGKMLEKAEVIGMEEFEKYWKSGTVEVVDLRGETEFKAGHVNDAKNVFVGKLPENLDKISKDKPVVIHCQAGDRSSIGYSVLKRHGFTNVKNYSGGIAEWKSAGKPLTI